MKVQHSTEVSGHIDENVGRVRCARRQMRARFLDGSSRTVTGPSVWPAYDFCCEQKWSYGSMIVSLAFHQVSRAFWSPPLSWTVNITLVVGSAISITAMVSPLVSVYL